MAVEIVGGREVMAQAQALTVAKSITLLPRAKLENFRQPNVAGETRPGSMFSTSIPGMDNEGDAGDGPVAKRGFGSPLVNRTAFMSSLRRTAAMGARSGKRPKPMMISQSKGWVCGRLRQCFPKMGQERDREEVLANIDIL